MRDETEVAGGGVDLGKGDSPLDIQRESLGWGWGAVTMTVIESRAKTGAGSWDHLA